MPTHPDCRAVSKLLIMFNHSYKLTQCEPNTKLLFVCITDATNLMTCILISAGGSVIVTGTAIILILMSGLNHIDFPTCRKVDAVDLFG